MAAKKYKMPFYIQYPLGQRVEIQCSKNKTYACYRN